MSQYGTAQYGTSVYGASQNTWTNSSGHIAWMVQVDWNNDGSFGSDIEPQSIMVMRFKRGRKARMRTDGKGQEHPVQESFWIEIRDTARRYDPFYTSSPLYSYLGASGVAMRIMAVNTTTKAQSEPVFTGALTRVEYNASLQRATLSGEGIARMLRLGTAEMVLTPCQPSTGYDAVFVANSTTPVPVNYWSGRTGGLYLQECVDLTLDNALWAFGQYRGSREYATDYPDYFYNDGQSAWDALCEIADGFCARLIPLRDGRVFVMDRQDTAGLGTAAVSALDALEKYGVERPAPFETLRNWCEVKVRPHAAKLFKSPWVVASDTAVWNNSGPVMIAANTTKDYDIEYVGDGLPMWSSFPRINSAVSDAVKYTANNKEDKSGTDVSPWGTGTAIAMLLTETIGGRVYPYGNNEQKTRLRLQNGHLTDAAWFFDLKVLAQGIQETGDGLAVNASDATSIAANGKRPMSLDNRWVQTNAMGAAIAQAYVDALATRERCSPVTLRYAWSGNVLYDNLLNYQPGKYVNFGDAGSAASLANFGISGRYLIVGQDVEWLATSGQDAIVSLTFEQVAALTVTYDGVSSGKGSAVSSVTWSHTVNNRDNRLLVVTVSKRGFSGTDVSSVTFGGVALTKLGAISQGTGNYPRAELWYMVAPAVSTANVVVTIASSTDYIEAGAVNFYNVNQVAPLGSIVTGSGAGGPASVSVAVESTDLVVDITAYSGTAATVGAGQTSRWNDTSDGTWRGACSTEPASGSSVVMSWTIPSGGWAQCAAAVKAA